MEKHKNELKLYYKSSNKHDRETLGYAQTLDVVINDQDLDKNNLTKTQFAELAQNMDAKVAELVDKNSEKYLNELKDKSFSDDEILTLLVNNPEIVRTPIAMIGEHTYFVESPFNLISKDLEIEGVKTNKGEEQESRNNDSL
jgi:arsenate reductase